MSREAIYSALFNLISTNVGNAAQFVTFGRLTKHFDDVTPLMCPALYLLQTGEEWIRTGKGIPPRRTLDAKIIIYTSQSPTSGLASPVINAALDAIDASLVADQFQYTVTLGGLAEHVYIDGRVIIDEGLLQTMSVTVVPLKILVP